MKKTLLAILTILCLCSLSVYATNTSVGKIGQSMQNGKAADKPSQSNPYQKLDKKPDKKPDVKPDKKPDKKPSQKPDKQPTSKPGGNRIPQ